MSITAIQMVTDAFRAANIIDEIQSPSAEQAVAGLRKLNQMLADWEVDGIRLGWYPVDSLSATLPIEAADERGVLHNLAVEICANYNIEPTARVAEIATDTYARFAKTSSQEVVADLSGLPCEDSVSYVAWPTG